MLERADEGITVHGAYLAAFRFVEAYWERGGRHDDQIAVLLSAMNPGPALTRSGTADPAHWNDFLRAVDEARKNLRSEWNS